jgi:hypothetical protein
VLERPDETAEKGDGDAPSSQGLAVCQQQGWALLEALSSSPSIASQLVQSSGCTKKLVAIALAYLQY